MVGLAPRLDQAGVRATLTTILEQIALESVRTDYRLVGTAASLLHGVHTPAGVPALHPPAWLPEARQYFARYDVCGVNIELSTVEVESSADTIETFGSGP